MTVPADTFSATLTVNGDATVALAGELDMATAPQLESALDPVVAQGPHEVVLDFTSLSFVDSSGVAVLVNTQHRLAEQGRTLSISGAGPNAMKVFEIAGLVDFLRVRALSPGER
jgi:anti-sigma B factor antagonist